MEEILEHFRFWDNLWKRYDKNIDRIKPTSKEQFIKELEKRYKVTKL